MKFWSWSPKTILHNLLSAHFFSVKNHCTLMDKCFLQHQSALKSSFHSACRKWLTMRELNHWRVFHLFILSILLKNQKSIWSRAENLLIGFLSESLVFCEKMSQWAIRSKNEWFAHFWWATWAICSWSLIFGERPERFAYIAHQKWGNERITNFFKEKTYLKHTKKLDF